MSLNRNGRSRIALGAVGACAVLVALVAASAFGFKHGTYQGTTSQMDGGGDPQPLMLDVNRKKTKVNIVFFEFSGPGCAPGTQVAGEKTAVRASGKFKWEDEFYGFIKGQFQHNEAEGTAELGGGPCDSGPITWTAERTSR